MEEDETRPILSQQTVNEADDDIIVKAKTVTETEAPPNPNHVPLKWGHYLMGPCLTIHLCSYLYCNMVISQYVYSYLAKQKYHDSSFLSNNGDSQCHTNKTSRAYIERTDAQKMTSDWLMLLALFSSIPGIVTDVVMGSFSDKYGRKNFVVISLIGTFLKTLLTAIGMSTNISVTYFLLFAGIEGVTGGWCFVVSIAYAYVSDLTASNTTRTFAITLVEISVGLGLVLSGVTAGYLIKYVGFVYSMIVISGLNGLNLIVILLFLPESLHKSKRQTTDIFRLFKSAFAFYIRDTSTEGKRWKYRILMLTYIWWTMSVIGRQSIEQMYQLNVPFCWNSVKIGWFSSISDVVRNIIGLSFIKCLQSCLLEEIIVIISGLSSIFAYILEALAINDIMLMMVPVVGIFSLLASPVIRSTLSKMTPPDKQGALFAGTAVMQSVCTVLSEVMLKSTYTATVASFRGFVFLVFGGFSVLTLVTFIIFVIASKLSKTKSISMQQKDIYTG